MRVLTPLQRTLTSCVLLLALVTLPYTVVTGTQSDLAPNDVEYDLQRAEDVPADWELAQPDTIDEATALSLLESLSSTSVDLDRTGKKKKKKGASAITCMQSLCLCCLNRHRSCVYGGITRLTCYLLCRISETSREGCEKLVFMCPLACII